MRNYARTGTVGWGGNQRANPMTSGTDGDAATAIPIRENTEAEHCEDASGVHLFVSPSVPVAGTPLRVLAVTDRPLAGELVVQATTNDEKVARTIHDEPAATSDVRHGGPPYFWFAEVSASRPVALSLAAPAAPPSAKGAVWPTRAAWSHDLENVYSAWIETLFDAPDAAMPSWSALHEVLRDRKRNLLFDAIEEQIRTRVDSVDSGRSWLATARTPVAMPGLAELFEASGAWEDFSTPSRDLRLLVAMDFALGSPAHVARRPTRYAMPIGKSATDVEKELEVVPLRALEEGRPIVGEVVTLAPRQDNPRVCDVKDSYRVPGAASAPAATPASARALAHKGPAKVATEAYRDGWDEIFGKKPTPPSAAN